LIATERPDIFSQLYLDYYAKLYKYTLHRVGDPFVAEDLVSEVFTKVLVKYHTYDPNLAKFSTWIYTITNNTITDYHKKNFYHNYMGLEQLSSNYSLEDAFIEKELNELLLKAVMSLDQRQQTIIILKFGARATNREIDWLLEITESNVGTILYRTLQKLRDILKEQDAV